MNCERLHQIRLRRKELVDEIEKLDVEAWLLGGCHVQSRRLPAEGSFGRRIFDVIPTDRPIGVKEICDLAGMPKTPDVTRKVTSNMSHLIHRFGLISKPAKGKYQRLQ